ncbi:hypothetical protein NP493_765g01073 [Ridgeia piscesae]|uniref:Uncharacterized protein n=1 Tax=Ridgeia piscesae TaxID=27915 RepID=A0AAD9NPS8_RIDPI|nr:hypothetical protein NP493_765g01073 [Ridgeia piscesae]
MDVGSQCAICGQLMGMVTFFTHMTGTPPVEFTLQKSRFMLKHFGRFTMAMSEKRRYTGCVVDRQLEKLHQLFTFYQQSLEDVYECGTNVLLEASDVLQRIQRMPHVFAGCIFFHNRCHANGYSQTNSQFHKRQNHTDAQRFHYQSDGINVRACFHKTEFCAEYVA